MDKVFEIIRVYVAITCLYRVEDGMAKLRRRARKLGRVEEEALTYHIDWSDTAELSDLIRDPNAEHGFRRVKYQAVAVEVSGPAVRINGWDFIGVIQGAASGEAVLLTLNGKDIEVPARYREQPTTRCEHCGTKRRRKQTYVLHNVSLNKWVQVGSTCLKDFFDDTTPERVAQMASWLTGFENYLTALGSAPEDIDPDAPRQTGPYGLHIATYLAHAARDIREHGWKSRGEYRHESTADAALETYHAVAKDPKADPAPEDFRKAAKVLEWMRGPLTETARSEYERNLAALVANGAEVVWAKHAGLLASAITCYDRAMDRAARQASEDKHGKGNHVGEVGQRLTVRARVTRLSYTEGYYGTTTVVGLRTLDGNALVWFASGVKEYDEGNVYEVTGTVKKHGEFAGAPQTIVNRCRFKAVTA